MGVVMVGGATAGTASSAGKGVGGVTAVVDTGNGVECDERDGRVRVVDGDTELVDGDSEVFDEASEVVEGCSEVLNGGTEVVEESADVVDVCGEVVVENRSSE